MSKPALCVCEIKGADQLDHNRAADQGFCFCYIDMLPKYNPPTSKVNIVWDQHAHLQSDRPLCVMTGFYFQNLS